MTDTNYCMLSTPKCPTHNIYMKPRNLRVFYEECGIEKQDSGNPFYCKECESKLEEGELEAKLIEIGNAILKNLPWNREKKEVPKCTRVEII